MDYLIFALFSVAAIYLIALFVVFKFIVPVIYPWIDECLKDKQP